MATRQADKRACTSGHLPTANQSEIREAYLNSVIQTKESPGNMMGHIRKLSNYAMSFSCRNVTKLIKSTCAAEI